MTEKDQNICLICDKVLDESITLITGDTLNKYIEASRTRQDNKHLKFKGLQSFIIHTGCSLKYTNKKSIQAHLKQLDNYEDSSLSSSTSNVNLILRSSSSTGFDFQNLCFLCEQDASDDFIEAQKKK